VSKFSEAEVGWKRLWVGALASMAGGTGCYSAVAKCLCRNGQLRQLSLLAVGSNRQQQLLKVSKFSLQMSQYGGQPDVHVDLERSTTLTVSLAPTLLGQLVELKIRF